MAKLNQQQMLAAKLVDFLQEQDLFDRVTIYVGDECWGDCKTYKGEKAKDGTTPGGTPYKWAKIAERMKLVLGREGTWLVFMFSGKAYHKLDQVVAGMRPLCQEHGTEIERVSAWVALVYAKE